MTSQVVHPVGLRERKKAEVRQALQDATLRLALAHGYDNVTVEAIADAVGVSTRTFSNYFSSKEEALFATPTDAHERLAAAIAARDPQEPPVAVLAAVLGEMADQLAERAPAWRSKMALVAQNPQLQLRLAAQMSRFEGVLAQGLAQRSGRDLAVDPYAELVAAAATGALRVALTHWRTGTGQSLHELLSRLFACLAAGLPDAPCGTSPFVPPNVSRPS